MAANTPKNNGWHGADVGKGWFGNRQYDTDPRTGQPRGGGWSTKTSASKRFKKWAKGKTKAQIKAAKKDIKRVRREHESERARQKRLEHNRELRRTRPERQACNERNRRLNEELKRRRQEYNDDRKQPRRPTMNCKWCPVDVELRGSHWVHVDGQPCRSHDQ